VVACEVACREAKKPHLQVLLAIADKPAPVVPKSKRVETG
jgi:ArsR family transcriptional regulator